MLHERPWETQPCRDSLTSSSTAHLPLRRSSMYTMDIAVPDEDSQTVTGNSHGSLAELDITLGEGAT
jgi:hypothetical protein